MKMGRSGRTSGNAILLILLSIALFGALAYTFLRDSKPAASKMTEQQARLSATELASFLTQVDAAVQKLIRRGCSENDISFSNSKDTDTFVVANDSATAPSDKSCHVFDPAGGGMGMEIALRPLQDRTENVIPAQQGQLGNIYFNIPANSVVGLGTAADDKMLHLNFLRPEICKAYNQVVKAAIDLGVTDTGAIAGDENATLAGRKTFCFNRGGSNQVGGSLQIRYVWMEK